MAAMREADMGTGWRGGRVGLAASGLALLATDMIVRGKRIEPAKITAAGYQFRFADVEPVPRHIIDQEPVT
jgi:hypothetical protein